MSTYTTIGQEIDALVDKINEHEEVTKKHSEMAVEAHSMRIVAEQELLAKQESFFAALRDIPSFISSLTVLPEVVNENIPATPAPSIPEEPMMEEEIISTPIEPDLVSPPIEPDLVNTPSANVAIRPDVAPLTPPPPLQPVPVLAPSPAPLPSSLEPDAPTEAPLTIDEEIDFESLDDESNENIDPITGFPKPPI